MNRREFLLRAGVGFLFSTVASLRLVKAGFASQTTNETMRFRFVVILDPTDKNSRHFLASLRSLSNFKYQNWQQSLSILNISKDRSEVDSLVARYGPTTTDLELPIMVALPVNGTIPEDVELWNQDWLASNKSIGADDPACYPRRNGSFWSVEGDWNPTREKVRRHLFQSPNHESGHFENQWLSGLSRIELQSIHSDHHDEMSTERATVHWSYVNRDCPDAK